MSTEHIQAFSKFLKPFFGIQKDITVVFDASNGAVGTSLPFIFETIPHLTSIFINNEPDPDFKAHGPNPIASGAEKQIKEKILETKADMGVMFDADADRAVFVDNTGEILPSFLSALLLLENSKTCVVDELVFESLKYVSTKNLSSIIPSKVGARFVKELMREHEAEFGAEYSGHFFFKDFFYADSGEMAAIKMINAVSKLHTSLHDFRKNIIPHSIVSKEAPIDQKTSWQTIVPKLESWLEKNYTITKRDGITAEQDDLWVNIRPSNTEPIIRIIGGGINAEKITSAIEEITKEIAA